ncbi:unnamed protein product [Candidula unifasciata]|uniref:C2H2-type domain-containing protein n=1 Tax=Candidula unifasciata TaxID=100452 RepID=A0A8S3YJW3_9EUPU|nr:unnamed protein product [Candidula unifasciata]
MDYESSSKFISSLAKFLQSLCNGYVEFDNGVQVIGHLYLSVDTGKTIDYILNEKVCKTDENSVTFISNSFHAQPAEKPKPPGKRIAKDSDKPDTKNEEEPDGYSNVQTEPRSTNVGTMPSSRNVNQSSPLSHGAKRPYSPSHKQSQVKSGRVSPKHKKSKSEFLEHSGQSQISNPTSDNSISSAPSPADDVGPSHSAQLSDTPHTSQLSESYQQSFFHPDEENSLADDSEERDIKPTIDTDVTFIKEEFAPSSSCSQSGNQSHDRTHGEDSMYPYQSSNQVFPGGYAGFGASQRSGFSSAGSSHAFSLNSGQASKTEGDGLGDQSVSWNVDSYFYQSENITALSSDNTCDFCGKVFTTKMSCRDHRNAVHLQVSYPCEFCGKKFPYKRTKRRHESFCLAKFGQSSAR